jgi:hypothetical protein
MKTAVQELAALPIDISVEVRNLLYMNIMVNFIQFLLYLTADRNWYLEGRGNCKSQIC